MSISIEHAVSTSVDNWFANVARKSAYFDELMIVLNVYFDKRGMWIATNCNGANYVMWQGLEQFQSVSLAACVDFALKFEPPAVP